MITDIVEKNVEAETVEQKQSLDGRKKYKQSRKEFIKFLEQITGVNQQEREICILNLLKKIPHETKVYMMMIMKATQLGMVAAPDGLVFKDA